MTVPLYMDVHVHRAITTGLRLREVDVIAAQEDGHRTADDDRMLELVGETMGERSMILPRWRRSG